MSLLARPIIVLLAALLGFASAVAAAPTPPALPRLRWAPPALRDPIQLSADPGYFAPRLLPGRDYVVRCPAGIRRGDMLLSGDPARPARNIVLIGCRSRGRLIVQYFSGVAHIEGTFWSPGPGRDGVDCGGPAAPSGVCRLQNVRIVGLSGSLGTVHADCLQPWGALAGIQVDRFTCDTNYQGEFLAGQSIGFVDQSRVNLSHNGLPNRDGHPGVLYWFGESDQSPGAGGVAHTVPVACAWCYALVRPDRSFQREAVYPGPGTTFNGRSVSPVVARDGRSLGWPAAMQVTGPAGKRRDDQTIIAGSPPGGDFASLDLEYVPYTSPGYQGR